MIWISFGKWNGAVGRFFIRRRLYWKKYKWTPFVWVAWRVKRKTRKELEELLGDAAYAIAWMGGSDDFHPDGDARIGWEKIVKPVMDEASKYLPKSKMSDAEVD